MYFQSTKLTNILFWRDIHSFVSIQSQLNIRALICVCNRIGRTQLGNYLFSDSKVSGTIARKTDSLHVHVFGLRPVCAINFSRDQSSAKLIDFLDSRLETRDSILEDRDSILEIIEYRVSKLEDRGSRIEARGSRLEDRGSRIEARGSRLEDRGSRFEGLSTYF